MSALESKAVAVDAAGEPLIRKTAGVCGGDACIRNTRIMVWLLNSLKGKGLTEQQILDNYPSLTRADLAAAREYARHNSREIEQAIRANEEDDE
jgi:uncharacterized protein (DUF433 family)